MPETDATVKMLREGLSEFNEGVGGWRALSHVRGEGMGASSFTIPCFESAYYNRKGIEVNHRLQIDFQISERVTHPPDRTLPILEEKVGTSRIQRRTKSLTVVPEVIIDRSVIITRMMMLCPPLMVAGSIAFYSVSPDQPFLTILAPGRSNTRNDDCHKQRQVRPLRLPHINFI